MDMLYNFKKKHFDSIETYEDRETNDVQLALNVLNQECDIAPAQVLMVLEENIYNNIGYIMLTRVLKQEMGKVI